MRFCRDKEDEKGFWADRGLDSKLDHFFPCESCGALMHEEALEETIWQEFDLCYESDTRLEIQSAAAEVRGERPYNLSPEIEIIQADAAFPLAGQWTDPQDPYYPNDNPL